MGQTVAMGAGNVAQTHSRWQSSAALGLLVVALIAMTGCDRSRSVATLSPPDALSASRTVSPTVDQTTPPPQSPRFTSIAGALAFIREHLGDVRVVLPDGLPEGVALAPKNPVYKLESTTRVGWVLHLVYGTKKHVYIQFESATFDGCGTEGARDVRVGDMPGALIATQYRSGWWTELIWPATTALPFGRYGLAGSLPPGRMLRIARSMPPIRPLAEVSHIC